MLTDFSKIHDYFMAKKGQALKSLYSITMCPKFHYSMNILP